MSDIRTHEATSINLGTNASNGPRSQARRHHRQAPTRGRDVRSGGGRQQARGPAGVQRNSYPTEVQLARASLEALQTWLTIGEEIMHGMSA